MKQYCYYSNKSKRRNTIMILFSYETKIINNITITFSGLYFLEYKGISVSEDKTRWSQSANKQDSFYHKFDTAGTNASNFINNKARMFEAEDDEDAINQIKLLKELEEVK